MGFFPLILHAKDTQGRRTDKKATYLEHGMESGNFVTQR